MLLENKIGLVIGVANQRSIAWACAEACLSQGATLSFTYQNERLKEKVEKLTANLPNRLLMPCDVTDRSQIQAVFDEIEKHYGRLDFLIHSIAYAPREALEGEFLETSREAFLMSLEISAYSLIELSRHAKRLMTNGGSIVTMTYYGSEKVVPNYNVMGVAKAALEASVRYLAFDLGKYSIRVNAISSGPIKTLAAMGVGDIGKMQSIVAERAPLKRNVQASEVGNTALFLLSDLSSAITGETIYVDCGYNIMGI
ncbi:MAG: enoyl-[acyl-carrier-protein] reductase [NADH] [Pyrinomonadaceae bacterium]|jgi:enoyl-[acyl-carrier protein] reductase I|nr:MAG: enoyl-[acyl-carrier-protein] reductase [NADH] [Pyrinomonadaceae bacterium]